MGSVTRYGDIFMRYFACQHENEAGQLSLVFCHYFFSLRGTNRQLTSLVNITHVK